VYKLYVFRTFNIHVSVHRIMNQQKQPTRCNLVIEFIIPKFIEGSTCFERYTAHHQELQTVFAASSLLPRLGGSHPAWTTAGHHMGI
jgi:hypothetical protein